MIGHVSGHVIGHMSGHVSGHVIGLVTMTLQLPPFLDASSAERGSRLSRREPGKKPPTQ